MTNPTDDEIKTAIEEFCGWTPCPLFSNPSWTKHPSGLIGPFHFEIPDYLNDLNAIHEAEKMLVDNFTNQDFPRARYIGHLENIVSRPLDDSWGWALMHATAGQRALALYRVIKP